MVSKDHTSNSYSKIDAASSGRKTDFRTRPLGVRVKQDVFVWYLDRINCRKLRVDNFL